MSINHKIVSDNLKLIRTCCECQFAKANDDDKELLDDFYHDLIIILLEYNSEILADAAENNHLNALVSAIVRNNLFSSTSRFYSVYKKLKDKSREINEKDEQIADL